MHDRLLPPLLALMRLRCIGVAEARRDLVVRLDAQAAAERAMVAIEHRIAREAEIASHLAATDATTEAYGRWLGPARREATSAGVLHDRAAAETTVARARLAASRAAAEAVRTVVEQRESVVEAEAERREQATIDELTRPSRAPG